MNKFRLSISLLLLFLFPISGAAQTVIVSDDFEDGDFTIGTVWSGDTGTYTVVDDAGNNRLRLNAPAPGSSFLATSSAVAYGSWEFFVRFDFSTLSGFNNLTLFLTSDIADLSGSISGYALLAGETGSDDVFKLVRYDGGSEAETVLSGTTNINNGGEYQVKVDRSSDGRWTLSVATGYGSTPTPEAVGNDNIHTTSGYFGFHPEYTSTRTEEFFFDDVVITRSPIEVARVNAISNQKFQILFTDDVDQATVDNADFFIDTAIGSPDGTSTQDNSVILTYNTPLPGGDYTVTINDVSDLSGTTIPANSTVALSLFDSFAEGDIIINEFMYDEPEGLAEYVEIGNITSKRFNLSGWELGDANATSVISGETLILGPNGFLVISSDTTALFNTFGSRSYVRMTSFPILNNSSGDAVRIFTDAGLLVDSLHYARDWGGNDVALERRSATAASTFRENWGDSPNASGGTPGQVNEIPGDSEPPSLSDLQILDSQTLNLIFSERLENGSAVSRGNYALTNGVGISKALFAEPDTVRLFLDPALQNATSYELAVTGVEDIFGNATADQKTGFTYLDISTAGPEDIFINEFMLDPPAGITEYVELYNPTSKSFDLQGWILSDNTGTKRIITDSSFVLTPDMFVVIVPDNTILNTFPNAKLLVMGSSFPALNNSGDDIVVRNSNGILLDSLRYSPEWGGEQVALERKTTAISGIFPENWGESPERIGSPGFSNAIAPDQSAPEFTGLNILNASGLQLIFSERLEGSSATDASNYLISPKTGIQIISVSGDTVTLFLSQELISGTTYEVTASDIRDIFGNTLSSTTKSTRYLELSSAKAGEVVINEILYSPGPEFVELFNASSKNFSLNGWQLGDGADLINLDGGITMEAGSYLVLTDSRSFASSIDNGIFLSDFPSLNDNGDAVYIRSEAELMVDSLFYDKSWGGRDGVSLERRDPLAASNDPSNWRTSTAQGRYSAGVQNSEFQPDEHPPELVFSSSLPGELVEVRFSEFIRLTPEVRFSIGEAELYVARFNPDLGNRIFLRQPATKRFKKAQPLEITVQNLLDVKGNTTASASIPVARPLEPGSVVINEIMYNPLSKSDDNRPDQSEYIELRNRGESALSLEGFTLHDAPDENGEVRTLLPVSTVSKWIPGNGILLVYSDTAASFARSQTAIFFELYLNEFDAAQTVRIDRSSLSLASTGDAIYLADSTGTTIDSVYYDESWQNPNLLDTRGVALERINPAGPSNNDSNWSSSTSEKGGTPGSENSIYQVPAGQQEEIGISFNPNPFSPDDDGFEDNLFINYKLDRADYLLKVNIFDRYGRRVRKLADGEPSGFDGSLIWDGRTDGGTQNRIGIYIVLFEAYNSRSGENRTFKELVVLAKRM